MCEKPSLETHGFYGGFPHGVYTTSWLDGVPSVRVWRPCSSHNLCHVPNIIPSLSIASPAAFIAGGPAMG